MEKTTYIKVLLLVKLVLTMLLVWLVSDVFILAVLSLNSAIDMYLLLTYRAATALLNKEVCTNEEV